MKAIKLTISRSTDPPRGPCISIAPEERVKRHSIILKTVFWDLNDYRIDARPFSAQEEPADADTESPSKMLSCYAMIFVRNTLVARSIFRRRRPSLDPTVEGHPFPVSPPSPACFPSSLTCI